jgi:NADH:ubiquinone reductase (non-electrogenic)
MLNSSSMGLRTVARRSFATSTFTRTRPSTQSLVNAGKLRNGARRGYADVKPAAPAAEAPKAPRPKRFRTLKWVWRATYVSLIGGVAYMAYGVYELRHPEDQPTPDPNKQNLVILGNCASQQ